MIVSVADVIELSATCEALAAALPLDYSDQSLLWLQFVNLAQTNSLLGDNVLFVYAVGSGARRRDSSGVNIFVVLSSGSGLLEAASSAGYFAGLVWGESSIAVSLVASSSRLFRLC